MKKNIFCSLLIASMFISCISNISAQTNNSYKKEAAYEIEILDDGSIIETIIEENSTNTKSSIKSGTKTVNYKNGSTTLWSISVKGTFSYNGTSVSCTNSTVLANSYSTYWKVTNKKSSRSGNTAIASATGKRYTAGVVVQTINREVKLSCNKNGDLF